MLARVVRGIENAADRGKVNAANRVRYRVVAVLAREERTRIKTDTSLTDAERTKELTRLDGIATIMAKTAARDSSLIQLLTDSAPLSPAQQEVRRTLLIEAGAPLAPEDLVVVTEPEAKSAAEERQRRSPVGASVPDVESVPRPRLRRLRSSRRRCRAPGTSTTGSSSNRCSVPSRSRRAVAPPAWSCPRRDRSPPPAVSS